MYQGRRFHSIAASIADWRVYGTDFLERIAAGYVDEIRYPHRGFFVIEDGKHEPQQRRAR